MGDILEQLNQYAVDLGGSDWVYGLTFALSAIDAVFPPLPSESVVVALAAIGASTGEPALILLGLAAALGAFIGDNAAFHLGRAIGVERFRPEDRPRLARTIARARLELDRRAALLILTARYIPVGRVAVNMTAGATGFSYRRFVPLSAVAAISWAAYSVLIGMLAGAWMEENPLLGAAAAVVAASIVGFLIDRFLQGRRPPVDVEAELDAAVEEQGHEES